MKNFNALTFVQKTDVITTTINQITSHFDRYKEVIANAGFGIGYHNGRHFIKGTDSFGVEWDNSYTNENDFIFYMAVLFCQEPNISL